MKNWLMVRKTQICILVYLNNCFRQYCSRYSWPIFNFFYIDIFIILIFDLLEKKFDL